MISCDAFTLSRLSSPKIVQITSKFLAIIHSVQKLQGYLTFINFSSSLQNETSELSGPKSDILMRSVKIS